MAIYTHTRGLDKYLLGGAHNKLMHTHYYTRTTLPARSHSSLLPKWAAHQELHRMAACAVLQKSTPAASRLPAGAPPPITKNGGGGDSQVRLQRLWGVTSPRKLFLSSHSPRHKHT